MSSTSVQCADMRWYRQKQARIHWQSTANETSSTCFCRKRTVRRCTSIQPDRRRCWRSSFKSAKSATIVLGATPNRSSIMKWITREKVKVDRVACPWLIRKFIDPQAEFLFVPADQVMEVAKREAATPYDVKDVEFGHHGKECSFDAFVRSTTLTRIRPSYSWPRSSMVLIRTTPFGVSPKRPASTPSPRAFATSD